MFNFSTGRRELCAILDGEIAAYINAMLLRHMVFAHGGKVGVILNDKVARNTNRCAGVAGVAGIVSAAGKQRAGAGNSDGAICICCVNGINQISAFMVADLIGAQQLDVQIALRQIDKRDARCIDGDLRSIDIVQGDRRGSRLPLDLIIISGSAGLRDGGIDVTVGVYFLLIKPVAYLARGWKIGIAYPDFGFHRAAIRRKNGGGQHGEEHTQCQQDTEQAFLHRLVPPFASFYIGAGYILAQGQHRPCRTQPL